MFWENSIKHQGQMQKSLKRLVSIIKMAEDIPPEDWDHTEADRYGLGTGSLHITYTLYQLHISPP
jgi:hypothetical protein